MGIVLFYLIDFLDQAIEVDVDAVSDGERCSDWVSHGAYRTGGNPLRDSACSLPSIQLGRMFRKIRDQVARIRNTSEFAV